MNHNTIKLDTCSLCAPQNETHFTDQAKYAILSQILPVYKVDPNYLKNIKKS